MQNIKFSVAINGFLVSIGLIVSSPASSCLNETGTDRNGYTVAVYGLEHTDLRQQLLTRRTVAETIKWARYFIDESKKKPGINSINNLATSLVRLGDYENAIKHLEWIEKRSPGRYQTAANLGTAYELMGNNKEALRWINTGIARNQAAHFGTEWLHARILEAKINHEKPVNSSILKLDFGNQTQPLSPKNLPLGNDGKPVSLFNLGRALRYQLAERTEFVNAPEPIVAGLLFDWANLEMRSGTLESAVILYDIAEHYGYPEKKLISLRKAEAQRILKLPRKASATEKECELCTQPEISAKEQEILNKQFVEDQK